MIDNLTTMKFLMIAKLGSSFIQLRIRRQEAGLHKIVFNSDSFTIIL